MKRYWCGLFLVILLPYTTLRFAGYINSSFAFFAALMPLGLATLTFLIFGLCIVSLVAKKMLFPVALGGGSIGILGGMSFLFFLSAESLIHLAIPLILFALVGFYFSLKRARKIALSSSP